MRDISIGYEPTTGIEHVVVRMDDPHPGRHLRSQTCPCGPRWQATRFRWVHYRIMPRPPGPSPTEQALVTLALYASDLRREIDALVYSRRKDYEHFERQRRVLLDARTMRTPRPYEGSLWAELRHAVHRWRSYRRTIVHWWSR